MKKTLVIVATIVGVVLLGNVLIASAQGGNGGYWPMGPGMMGATGNYTGSLPFGPGVPGGMMGRGHGMLSGYMMAAGGMHEQVWSAIAEKLGMSYDELVAAIQNGQTIQQLAEAKGVSLEDLKQAALDAMRTALAELVKQGVLTQEQADWMLDRMDSMPMFNFGSGFGLSGCHGGQTGPGGMMGGWGRGRGMMPGWGGNSRWTPPSGNSG